jgi:hypothetical protein
MYGVVFLHSDPDNGKRKLISSPESLEAESVDEAKKEGSQILEELPPEHRDIIKPLAIVEINDDMKYGLQGCERVFLPMKEEDDGGEAGELEFVDVTPTSYWSSQAWWQR